MRDTSGKSDQLEFTTCTVYSSGVAWNHTTLEGIQQSLVDIVTRVKISRIEFSLYMLVSTQVCKVIVLDKAQVFFI